MKLYIAAAALVAASLSVASSASAAETYISGGLGSESMDFSAVGVGTANIPVVTGRFGYKSDNWWGVEGDLSLGVGSSDISNAPVITVKMQSAAAIYGVVFVPVGKKADLILRAGYGHQASVLESGSAKVATNDGAFSYGVGADFKVRNTLKIRADYTRIDIDSVDSAVWSLSLVHTF